MVGVSVRAAIGLTLVLLAATPLRAAEWLRFHNIGLEDGLAQLSIVAAMQDQRGFMWFGTQGGLNRYDGYEIRVYKRVYGENGDGLSDNYVQSLAQTADGLIWIGTSAGGLNRYDPRSGEFLSYEHDAADPHALAGNQIRTLEVDESGRLWVGTGGAGVDRLDPASGRFEHLPGLPNLIIEALMIEGDRVWVGTAAGLFEVDAQRFEVIDMLLGPRTHVTAIDRGHDGRLWVGTLTGLYAIDPDPAVSTRHYVHRSGRSDSLANDQVQSLLVDRDGEVWIGTTNGLSRYLPQADAFESYYPDPLDESSLAANQVSTIVQDRTGILWFGTWTGGVSKLNRGAISFRGYRERSDDPLSLPDIRVRGFHEAANGAIWVATLGGGLARFDPQAETFVSFRHRPGDPTTIGSDELHAVAPDRDGMLWLATRNAGLSRFDPDTGIATRLPHRSDDSNSPAGNHILDVMVDDRNRLWIGTLDAGVSRLDIDRGEWRHYRHDPDRAGSLPANTVGHLFQAGDGSIWLGTRGSGFGIYREASDDFLQVPAGASDQPLLHGTVTYITESGSGDIWMGTQGGGFARLIARGKQASDFHFQSITSGDGLPSDAIGGVLVDDTGRVWVSTLAGISAYDPADGSLDNFSAVHGTQRRSYYVGSALKARDGTLYFGGLDGMTRFTPQEFALDTTPPQVVLTELLISNRPVGVSEDSPLSQTISFTDQLRLNHTQNIFSFEFSGLHYAEPDNNEYRYQLEGFDSDWVQTPASRRHATYTNLDAGEYVFRVKAASRDGVWSEPASVSIRVLPPPWETGWAYLGYAMLAVALLLLIAWVRSRQVAARREARRAIREGQERLKLALWGSGDEMWYLDLPSGGMQRLSYGRGAEIRTEEPLDNLDALWAIMHPDDRDAVRSAMDRHVSGHTPYFEASYRVRGQDGQWLWAMSKGRVVEHDERGKARVIAGATKDVTQLKNTERALRELNERLESMVDERTVDLQRANADLKRTLEMLTEAQSQLVESEKMASLGNLVAGVAHEINTPVGVAVTAASYMQGQVERALAQVESGADQPEIIEAFCRKELTNIKFLLQNLNRAAELIKSFKQVAVDQSSEDRRRFRIAQYLEEILMSLQPKLKRTQHQVEVECDPELQLESYPGALYQVISNLLMNSLVHGLADVPQGQILIRVRAIGDRVVIDYRDNGCGFGPEVEARIFEPFFTTRRGSGGSGLGMHIVYNLVTQVLRGRISVKGKPGQGIEVRIEIPSSLGEEAAESA